MNVFEHFRVLIARLWFLPFLLMAASSHARDFCNARSAALPSYPAVLNLRKLLCAPGATQNENLAYAAAKASPEPEIQWIAMMWQRNYKNDASVSIERVLETVVNECNGAAQENIALMTIFRRTLYQRAVLFGRFPKTKKLDDFSNDDAEAEAIARAKTACNVDLSQQRISWQVLDR